MGRCCTGRARLPSGCPATSCSKPCAPCSSCTRRAASRHEIDAHLMEALAPHGTPEVDGAGNIILSLAGPEGGGEAKVALLAHKDEIGGLVKRVEEGGRLIAQTLGDAHPVDLGRGAGRGARPARHGAGRALVRRAARVRRVAAAQAARDTPGEAGRTPGSRPSSAPRRWRRPASRSGSRVVPARWRKRPVRLGDDGEYVACLRARRQGRRRDAARAGRPAGSPRTARSSWCSRPARRSAARASQYYARQHRRRGDRGVRGDAGGRGVRASSPAPTPC